MKSAKTSSSDELKTRAPIKKGVRQLITIICSLLFSNSAMSQTTIQVGTAGSTSAYPLVSQGAAYNYSQQIYKATDGLSAYNGQYVFALRFFWNGTGDITNSNSWTIYLANSAKTTFSNNTNWEPFASFTQVYNGGVSLPPTPGWFTIVLDVPYQYTGNSLIVAIDENTAGTAVSNATFRYTTSASTLLAQRSSSDISPSAPGTAAFGPANRADVQFDFFSTTSPTNVVSVTSTLGTFNRSYPNFKYAIDAINSGTHQGVVTVEAGSSDNQILSVSAQTDLLASGAGSASYSSLLIRPAFTNITISGSLPTSGTSIQSILNLNGSQNVVIDGRIGSTGTTKNLTIENTMASQYAAGLTFSGADNDTLRYCTVKSSSTSTTSGVGTISFLYHTSWYGCNDNSVEFCDITKSGITLPNFAIASTNSSSANKSENNRIINCNISDFQRAGIWLGNSSTTDYNHLWTISRNNFFQSGSVAISASNFMNWAILIGYHDASNTYRQSNGVFTISENNIGGNGAGGNWTITSGSGTYTSVGGIFIYGSTTAFSEINGNTISNFAVQTYVADQAYFKLYGFNGIYNHLGKVKIGSSIGNNVHDISVTHSSANWGGFISGIYSSTSSDLSCEIMNNSIHDISLTGGSGEFQYVYLVYSYAGSSVSTNRSDNNEVYDIDALKGRYVYGMYIDGGAERNRIRNIATDGTIGELYGIRWVVTGSGNASSYRLDNNEIILGLDKSGSSTALNKNIYGIHTNSQYLVMYYNSILLEGTAITNNSSCLRINTTGTGPVIVNNLLYNNRSGGAGRHMCHSTAINLASNPGYLTSSNNAYVFSTNLGEYNTAIAFSGGTSVPDLISWTSAATNETNSRDTLSSAFPVNTFFPTRNAPGNLLPSSDKWLCAGIVVSQTNDITNASRNNPAPTTIGAYELDCPVILPIELLTFSATCTSEGTQLHWISATETNNQYFTIDISDDGTVFSQLATIQGAGNSTSNLTYSFLDESYSGGLRYYRLSQTDFDGTTTILSTFAVQCETDAFNIRLMQNPVWEHIDIFFNGIDAEHIKATLLTTTGQLIPAHVALIDPYRIRITPSGDLQPGCYLLQVSHGTKSKVISMIKAE